MNEQWSSVLEIQQRTFDGLLSLTSVKESCRFRLNPSRTPPLHRQQPGPSHHRALPAPSQSFLTRLPLTLVRWDLFS